MHEYTKFRGIEKRAGPKRKDAISRAKMTIDLSHINSTALLYISVMIDKTPKIRKWTMARVDRVGWFVNTMITQHVSIAMIPRKACPVWRVKVYMRTLWQTLGVAKRRQVPAIVIAMKLVANWKPTRPRSRRRFSNNSEAFLMMCSSPPTCFKGFFGK